MRQEMKVVSPAKMETETYQGERHAVMDNLNVQPLPMTTMSSSADTVENDREEKFMPRNCFQTLLKELNCSGVDADDVELKFVNFDTDKVCICMHVELTVSGSYIYTYKYCSYLCFVNIICSGAAEGIGRGQETALTSVFLWKN